MKELTLIERAAVALKSSETEKHLVKLASEHKSITEITNAAGRTECHAAMMACKNARIEIEKAGKAAREDATKFSKAVIEEEKRLVAIISPEEERLSAIRDEWDAAREAERKAAEELERQRVQKIRDDIAEINAEPTACARMTIADIQSRIDRLKSRDIGLQTFGEFTGEALQAQGKAIAAMQMMISEKQAEAEEKARQEALRIAEEERMAAERAELSRMRKEQEERDRIAYEEWLKKEAQARADRDAIYAEQQRVNAELDRQREEQRKAQAEIDLQRADAESSAKAERDKQEAEFARQREEMRKQQEAIDAEKARLAAEEQSRIDAENKRIAGEAAKKSAKKKPVESVRPSDREIIQSVAEKFNTDFHTASQWIKEIDFSGQEQAA
jgi:hypothetical protein